MTITVDVRQFGPLGVPISRWQVNAYGVHIKKYNPNVSYVCMKTTFPNGDVKEQCLLMTSSEATSNFSTYTNNGPTETQQIIAGAAETVSAEATIDGPAIVESLSDETKYDLDGIIQLPLETGKMLYVPSGASLHIVAGQVRVYRQLDSEPETAIAKVQFVAKDSNQNVIDESDEIDVVVIAKKLSVQQVTLSLSDEIIALPM